MGAFDPIADGSVLPGDLLILTNGANSTVDVGFGPGIYPIVEVTAADVRLSVNLTSNDDSAWKIRRTR